MILIFGLGNPSQGYEKTRHNLGAIAVEKFRRKNNFPNWKEEKNCNFLSSEKEINKKKIKLIKSLLFMNESGKVLKTFLKKKELETKNIIVVHDDIDLPLGKIKISFARGSAGHKGVESIIKELRTKNFIRLRLGVQPEKGKPKKPELFLLSPFEKKEEKLLKRVILKASQALETLIKDNLTKAMNIYNR
jgi:PTH1 family peptidyl-tRNA hydrolase